MWSAADHSLWFVDIKGRRILRFHPDTGERRHWPAPHQISFLLPEAGGSFVAGFPGSLARFRPETGLFEPLITLDNERRRNRLNDACVDGVGRLWFGSMDDSEIDASGALYSWHGVGVPAVHDQDFVISNGPAHSPDGKTLYHTDTIRRTIYRFDVAEDGSTSGKWPFIEIGEGDGWPDGTTIDSEGCLWVALWEGWAVRRYSPRGELLETVPLPCAKVTKLALGGTDLRTAFVTTARRGLSPIELEQQRLAGGLFTFQTKVPGLPHRAVRRHKNN